MDTINSGVFVFDWSYPLAFVWGLLIIVALAGWGRFVGHLLMPGWGQERLEWGVSAAWGLAVFLVLSGPMLMLSAFSTIFVASFVLTGLAMALRNFRFVQWGCWGSALPAVRSKVLVSLLLLLIGWTYAGAVAARQYNPYDDLGAYFALVKMMLDTGTLYDPFNFRLVGALGGQTTLTTLVLGFFPWKYAHLFDIGIAGLIMLGMTQEMVPTKRRHAWIAGILLVTFALMFPMPRANIGGETTGTVLFMALFRSFELVAARRICGWRSAFLLGGVITAGSTLRAHYFFIMAVLCISFTLWRFWEDRRDRREIARETLMTLFMSAMMLAPWWVVAYRSCGVFLYPLVKGNQRPEFEVLDHQHLSPLNTICFVGSFLVYCPFLLLFLPVFFLKKGRQQRQLFMVGGALLLISLVFIAQFTFGLPFDLYRYLAPIGLGFGLYAAGIVAQQLLETPAIEGARFPMLREKIAVTAITTAIYLTSFSFLLLTVSNTTRLRLAPDARCPMWTESYTKPVGPVITNEAEREYHEAFARIRPGAKVLIALDYPFLLNYQSHSIFSVDIAGAVSPSPGLPYFHGSAAVKEYLLGQGIHYIAHVPFDLSPFLHSRACAAYNRASPLAVHRYFAPFETDLYDNVDQLAKSNRILFDSPTIRVIALETSAE